MCATRSSIRHVMLRQERLCIVSPFIQKCPEKIDLERQEMTQWLSWDTEVKGWGVRANGYQVSFGGDGNVQKLYHSHDYTILPILKKKKKAITTLNCTLTVGDFYGM